VPNRSKPDTPLYKVTLTADERAFLTKLVSTGKSSAQKIKHANILLAVDETANGRVSDQEVERYDSQYIRNGTVDNFMFSQPLGNWRRVSVRKRKTQWEFAEEIAHLLDIDFPDAEVVVLVMDNFERMFLFRRTFFSL